MSCLQLFLKVPKVLQQKSGSESSSKDVNLDPTFIQVQVLIWNCISLIWNAFNIFSVVRQVEDMQNTFCDYGLVKKSLPLLARKDSTVGMEVMALIDVMLFNANRNVQVTIYNQP